MYDNYKKYFFLEMKAGLNSEIQVFEYMYTLVGTILIQTHKFLYFILKWCIYFNFIFFFKILFKPELYKNLPFSQCKFISNYSVKNKLIFLHMMYKMC